MAVSKACF